MSVDQVNEADMILLAARDLSFFNDGYKYAVMAHAINQDKFIDLAVSNLLEIPEDFLVDFTCPKFFVEYFDPKDEDSYLEAVQKLVNSCGR